MTILLSLLLIAAPALRAVVYPDRAQVTRGAAATCAHGSALVPFEGITPAADAASFRALSPDGAVLGVRSELRAQAASFRPEAEKLTAEIRKLEAERQALLDVRGRAAVRSRVANQLADIAVQLVGRELLSPAPDPAAWERAFDKALKAQLAASGESVGTNAELRQLQHRLSELRRRSGELSQAAQRQAYRAEVILSCTEGQTVHAELSYLVGGASWEPLYEARADEKGGKVELSMFATVRQATGEDWTKAQIILSTAIPRSDATPPEVRTLRVGALERKEEKKVLVRRDEEQRHAEAAGGASADEGGGAMEAQGQGLSVQLVVKEPSTISGDNVPARLFVGAHKLPAQFAYRTVPKLMPYVFRVADLVNTAPFPLLPGPLDAFRKSGFLGRSPLARVAEGERFHLTFGVEENVKVKRIVRDELRRDTGLFNQNRRFHYAYTVELTSHLAKAETIEVEDHLPLSELDDVHVELEDGTTGPRQLNSEDGLVTWKVALAPGQKKDVLFGFHVDVPGSYDSGGL